MGNFIFKLLIVSILFISCNQYDRTPSGMAYKIEHKSSSEKRLKHGNYLKMNVEYRLKSNDSILSSSYNLIPIYYLFDTLYLTKYSINEIIFISKKGDNIDFILNTDTLVKLGRLKYNNTFKTNDLILGKAEILNVFDNFKLVNSDYKKEKEILEERRRKEKEVTKIEEKSNNSKAIQNCVGFGDESCIDKVRDRFNSTGKNILGEQYLGNGQFGISFLDQSGGTYNAKVSTDCKCDILNVRISVMR
jgi:hypothetical protein